jgi:isopenicillin-N N-acyltransferase-like protein
MFGGSLRVLEIFGDSSDLGRGHGAACDLMIRKYLNDRIELTTQDEWSGGSPDRDLILEIAEGTLEYHERFAEEIYIEMVAMADAAGITPAEAVVVGGFTDLIDVVRSTVGKAPVEHNCTAVLNPEAGFFAQTWDMHASAGEFVIMLKVDPIAGPCAVVQTTAGCLGQIGMNEAGISIGINNLTSLGRPGVTWPFVVRKVLEQTELDSAVEVVTGAELAGGHNFLLMGPDGEAVNIEAMPNGQKVTRTSTTAFVHANHCLDDRTAEEEGERLPEHVENSNMRLDMATELANDPEAFFEEPLISRRVEELHDVGTCGAVIIEPGKRRMKAVWGVPGDHPWETFQL